MELIYDTHTRTSNSYMKTLQDFCLGLFSIIFILAGYWVGVQFTLMHEYPAIHTWKHCKTSVFIIFILVGEWVFTLMHEYSAKSWIKNAAHKSRTILRLTRQNENQMIPQMIRILMAVVFQPIKVLAEQDWKLSWRSKDSVNIWGQENLSGRRWRIHWRFSRLWENSPGWVKILSSSGWPYFDGWVGQAHLIVVAVGSGQVEANLTSVRHRQCCRQCGFWCTGCIHSVLPPVIFDFGWWMDAIFIRTIPLTVDQCVIACSWVAINLWEILWFFER